MSFWENEMEKHNKNNKGTNFFIRNRFTVMSTIYKIGFDFSKKILQHPRTENPPKSSSDHAQNGKYNGMRH